MKLLPPLTYTDTITRREEQWELERIPSANRTQAEQSRLQELRKEYGYVNCNSPSATPTTTTESVTTPNTDPKTGGNPSSTTPTSPSPPPKS